ncbi:MAG: hypothetical protein HC881_07020 [Leptolyngbyaceae cyanobacterium SL_7_1]|nr:hypothetical protein [Leptolyngbyaceae cyanobacterium SL_7_1]
MKAVVGEQKLLKFGIWLSPGLIAAGVVAGLVSSQWTAVPLGLIGVGIAIASLV